MTRETSFHNAGEYCLSTLKDMMQQYNRYCAPGSECEAWADFVQDCIRGYGVCPWSEDANQIRVSALFWGYWLDVANGESADYQTRGYRED